MLLRATWIVAVVWAVIAVAVIGQGRADVPRKVNYQGRLVNAAGEVLPGTHTAVFRVFDAEARRDRALGRDPAGCG